MAGNPLPILRYTVPVLPGGAAAVHKNHSYDSQSDHQLNCMLCSFKEIALQYILVQKQVVQKVDIKSYTYITSSPV